MNENETLELIKSGDVNNSILSEIFQVLNEKEQNIIKKRFAISVPTRQTLEQIGREYGITRERVRQIEKNAISKLKRISEKTGIINLINITNAVLNENNQIMPEKKLLKEVIKRTGGIFIANHSLVLLSFEVNPNLEKIKKSKTNKKSWFDKSKLNKKNCDLINNSAERMLRTEGSIVKAHEFLSNLQNELKIAKSNFSKATISSVLVINKKVKRIEEGYGLTSWRAVKPKSIRDKALIVLNRIQKPLHFRSIAKLIHEQKFDKKKVTTQAVHNELIRYTDFVLVGRGIYALKEWGFENGTVKDVITDILRTHGPLNKSRIIEEVLKRRQVKTGTISLNLQKYPEFKRVGRAVYSIESGE